MSEAIELTDKKIKSASASQAFRVWLAGADMDFRECFIDDPVPTGRQIAEALGGGDPAEKLVLLWLPNGMLEELRPDETTDLRGHGAEKFIVVRGDRSFRLEIEGRRQEWPASFISSHTIKVLGGVDPDKFDVYFLREDEPDRELADDEIVNLSEEGLERFRFQPRARTVEIFVNERPVYIERGDRTGAEIKATAIQQGVPIQPDFL